MNILRFDSEESWRAGVVSFWRDRLHMRPELRQCLASGNTPIPIYRELVRTVREGQASFQHAVIFALDEFGGLAPDDPGTCKNMLWRDLISQIDLLTQNFHFLDAGAPDLEAECRAYDQAVGRGFDLVVLGIGLNGHLGMNEPGSAPNSPTRRTELEESTINASARYLAHKRLPRWGLTVGMQQFFDSREVWLIATGHGKADIISSIVRGEIHSRLPASLMHRHPNCSLFLDPAAGSLL